MLLDKQDSSETGDEPKGNAIACTAPGQDMSGSPKTLDENEKMH